MLQTHLVLEYNYSKLNADFGGFRASFHIQEKCNAKQTNIKCPDSFRMEIKFLQSLLRKIRSHNLQACILHTNLQIRDGAKQQIIAAFFFLPVILKRKASKCFGLYVLWKINPFSCII
jgi:hypothetical protein